MKNVHLLPTDKPSRLFYNKKDSIFTIDNDFENVIEEDWFQDYNIYITSDEEIKEGDWTFDGENPYKWTSEDNEDCLYNPSFENYKGCKKIILTTDPDLIADGVQAIDDEFLEWFVKNPTCEEVGIKSKKIRVDKNFNDISHWNRFKYEIIIPQEEPKQETLNKINNMNEEIKKQINLLEEEQTRVKQFINENNFNCTTAPYVIAKQYRDEIKKHIKILKMNLEN
jgi:hypothetical protein